MHHQKTQNSMVYSEGGFERKVYAQAAESLCCYSLY